MEMLEEIKNQRVTLVSSLIEQGFSISSKPTEDLDLKLNSFLALLYKWNQSHDLVGPGSLKDLIFQHLIDSLAAALVLESVNILPPFSTTETFTYADIGTGAGLPGIIWHLLYKDKIHTYLLEPRSKRTAFLKEVKRELKLENITIIEGRSEALKEQVSTLDYLSMRALKPTPEVMTPLLEIQNLKTSLWLTGPNTTPDDKIHQPKSWKLSSQYHLAKNNEHQRRIYTHHS